MGQARAVLCTPHWEEPFGLVACEAQAAGAPVIGYRRGGLAEVVADGETGYLVAPGDVTAAVAAVQRVSALDRHACRARVERLFRLETMLYAYEAFYAETLALDAAR
jgi:UDP-glucose:tetrahydrobiopterin glucosyltransferase